MEQKEHIDIPIEENEPGLWRRILESLGLLIGFLVAVILLGGVVDHFSHRILTPEEQLAFSESDFSRVSIMALIFKWVLTTLAALVVVAIFRFSIKGQWKAMGFFWKGGGRDFLEGLAWGVALIGIGFLIILISGAIRIDGIQFSFGLIVGYIVFFLVQTFMEELLFRGYIQTMIRQRLGAWVAIGVGALLFGLIHIFNEDFSWIALVNITLGGLFMGILFEKIAQYMGG